MIGFELQEGGRSGVRRSVRKRGVRAASEDKIRELIYGVGFYNNKAKYIKRSADLIADVTTTRAAHVKVKTAEDLKRGGPPVLRPPAAPKLPPASRKKKAPAKVNDEDEWDEDEAADLDAPPPKRRAGLRASARRARPSLIFPLIRRTTSLILILILMKSRSYGRRSRAWKP